MVLRSLRRSHATMLGRCALRARMPAKGRPPTYLQGIDPSEIVNAVHAR